MLQLSARPYEGWSKRDRRTGVYLMSAKGRVIFDRYVAEYLNGTHTSSLGISSHAYPNATSWTR